MFENIPCVKNHRGFRFFRINAIKGNDGKWRESPCGRIVNFNHFPEFRPMHGGEGDTLIWDAHLNKIYIDKGGQNIYILKLIVHLNMLVLQGTRSIMPFVSDKKRSLATGVLDLKMVMNALMLAIASMENASVTKDFRATCVRYHVNIYMKLDALHFFDYEHFISTTGRWNSQLF